MVRIPCIELGKDGSASDAPIELHATARAPSIRQRLGSSQDSRAVFSIQLAQRVARQKYVPARAAKVHVSE